jgi:hypothetical protein
MECKFTLSIDSLFKRASHQGGRPLWDWLGILRRVLIKSYRHVDLKGNLIKAMMVMNWLNMLEVEKF